MKRPDVKTCWTALAVYLIHGIILVTSSIPVRGAQSVSLAWDATTDLNVAGYNVYYGTNSGQYVYSSTVDHTTNTTVTGLQDGVTYFFVVTAFNTAGLESPWSNEVIYSVPPSGPGPGSPVISWSNPADLVYGTALSAAQLNATASVPGGFAYNPPAGTVLAAGNGQVLSVTFTPTDTTSYLAGAKTVNVNVQKAPLSITADNKSMIKGAALPALSASCSGWVNGDSAAVLTGAVTLSTTASSSSAAGTYPIVASGATSPDYAMAYVNGVMTVLPAGLVSVAVTSVTNSTAVGQTQPWTATGTYSDGSTQTETVSVTWLSSNPSVATINSTGLVTAVGAGSTLITATKSGVSGSATLTVVSGSVSTSTSTVSFANSGSMIIPNKGAASPYPATINVSGVAGTLSKLGVTLSKLGHAYPNNLDILLVSPTGQQSLLMSGAGSHIAINNVTLTFDDTATAKVPATRQITTGTYLPTVYQAVSAFPAPAPGGPYGAALSVFKGINPNGSWSLYIVDRVSKNAGILSGGWSLAITTVKLALSSLKPSALNASPSIFTTDGPLGAANALGPEPVKIGVVRVLANGQLDISLSGQPGQKYQLQSSTDLIQWQDVDSGVMPDTQVIFTDTTVTATQKFYRNGDR